MGTGSGYMPKHINGYSLEELELAGKDPKKAAELEDKERQRVINEQEKRRQNKIFESDEHLKEKNITLDEYIQLKNAPQMNIPTEIKRTIINVIGSGGSVEASASLNKGSTYNRNSKKGTRLVRTR